MSGQPQTAREIQTIATDWLLEKHEGEGWSAERQVELDMWLAASLAHRIAYWRLDAAWTRADLLTALKRRGFDRPTPTPPRNRNVLFRAVAALAVVAAVAGGALTLDLLGFDVFRPALKTYATAVGERERLTLADGSQIELNTDTMLRADITAHIRKIWLDRGEAYFDVTHNAKRPFVVMVAGHRLVDIGTKFVVRREDGRYRVAVLEGSVALDDGTGGEKVLAPGDVAIASAGRIAITRKSKDELTDAMGWQRGVIVFDRTTLADAAREFNRYTNRKLVIADSATASLTIDGTFPSNNPQAFTRLVQAVLGLKVKDRGQEVVISK